MRRLVLSKKKRNELANVLAGVLIAIIVVCVVVIVWTLVEDGRFDPQPRDPTTRSSTATPSRTSVYYRNCAEAHAAGRYDIPDGDPAYRPGLDRDHNGIACESRKSSRLAR